MRSIRVSIATVTVILICFGVVMIYSASGIYALQRLGKSTYFLERHLLFLMVGFILALGVMAIDYRDIRKYSKPLMMLSVVMLCAVLVPGIGKSINGARRWFQIGAFSFQPSEFTKVAVLIYVSDFLARKQNKIRHFRQGFFPVLVVLAVICLLILKQPDLGSSVLIATIVIILLFVAGADIRHIGFLGVLALPVVYFLIVRVPYRLNRILAFLDPWETSQGIGFQLTQSQIALGSGGVFGLGLGKSVQKLFYLPAAHTDFILSIVGEELGLLGALMVVILFAVFVWQGARIAKRTIDPFGYFLSIGIVTMIGLQAVINIGVSIGMLPTKGLPLPFVSYGGSALVFNLIAVGLLLNISRVQEL
ncbi:MAG: putative lipid II flippase FtsW [Candidatus Omnitrophota bacterium]